MGLLLVLGMVLATGGLLMGGLITALVANSKGYRPWFWILAMGPIGLVVMLVKQSLNQAPTPEERERWESQADWTGGVLSALTFVMVFALPILGAAAFMVARTAAIPAPPAIAPPPIAPPMVVTPELPASTGDELKIEPPANTAPADQQQDVDPAANGNPK